jgi:hypothetical protein
VSEHIAEKNGLGSSSRQLRFNDQQVDIAAVADADSPH